MNEFDILAAVVVMAVGAFLGKCAWSVICDDSAASHVPTDFRSFVAAITTMAAFLSIYVGYRLIVLTVTR